MTLTTVQESLAAQGFSLVVTAADERGNDEGRRLVVLLPQGDLRVVPQPEGWLVTPAPYSRESFTDSYWGTLCATPEAVVSEVMRYARDG